MSDICFLFMVLTLLSLQVRKGFSSLKNELAFQDTFHVAILYLTFSFIVEKLCCKDSYNLSLKGESN